jgi:hypothetical protein
MATAAFFVANFLLTRQTQFALLGGLGAPWAVLCNLLMLRSSRMWHVLFPMLAYAVASATASIMVGNDASGVTRFLVITIGTLTAFYIRPVSISSLALLPLTLQAVGISVVSIALAFMHDPSVASAARFYVKDAEWGDIYSFDGFYYRVQLIGNALLPLLFLIGLWKYKDGAAYRWTAWLALAGVIAAGNLTYHIVIVVAVLIRLWPLMRKSARARIVIALALFGAVAVALPATVEVFDRKFTGSESMDIRYDQVDVAKKAWSNSPAGFLIGAGLGAPYPDGRDRDYSHYQYIELQILYLTYQLGLLGMLIYFATLVVLVFHFLDPTGQLIFWLYVLSGCTNPTVLDTNQILAAMMLVCFFPRRRQGLALTRSPAPALLSQLPPPDPARGAHAPEFQS